MQTFLPYCSICKSMECLDTKRLGKQRVEAFQIYKILSGETPNSRWKNHPAVKMWNGWLEALTFYMDVAIIEWVNRGYRNTMKIIGFDFDLTYVLMASDKARVVRNIENSIVKPDWFGRGDFHESHQSNLLRKMPEYYKRFGWKVPDNLPYIWPEGKNA